MIDLKKEIHKFLDENINLSIATCVRNNPWICVVIYANDDSYNFYFTSDTNARHSQDIIENEKVACAINHEELKEGYIKALQFEGIAERIDTSELPKAFKLYIKKFPFAERFIPSVKKILSKGFKWRFYKINATKMYYMDSELFEKGERKEFILDKSSLS